MKRLSLAMAVALAAFTTGRSAEFDLDSRLSVHTLVREDLFAGLLADDLERLAAAETALERLLRERPAERADVIVLQGAIALYRAARANEASRPAEFRRQYAQALQLFDDALRLSPAGIGPAAVSGGAALILERRIPDAQRQELWARSYASYRILWEKQRGTLERLPVHMRGELLAGLAQTAERTGRIAEAREYVELILKLLPETPYAAAARRWQSSAELPGRPALVCQSCHEPGRLSARRAALSKPH